MARAARELQRLHPAEVRSWTSDPPFPARTTYLPMIGEDLARIRGLGDRDWMALQDRALLVVIPEGDFLLPWLLHSTMYELCGRPCCAPFRVPKPGSQ